MRNSPELQNEKNSQKRMFSKVSPFVTAFDETKL